MEFKASCEDIAMMSHPHPTYSEALKEAALAALENRPLHIQIFNVSNIFIYLGIASFISSKKTNSLAVCDLSESPGPILTESHLIFDWSERVGDPQVFMFNFFAT